MYKMINNVPVWGEPLEDAVAQAVTCARRAEAFALMADHHIGYAMPIGGVAAYEASISPSGVGYDISCLAAGTRVTLADGRRLPIEAVINAGNLLGNHQSALTNVGPAFSLIAKTVNETLRLRVQSGDELQLTSDHLLLTPTGWKEAGQLQADDLVAVSSYVGVEADDKAATQFDYRLLRLLGYAMGDGHTSISNHRISFFTSRDEDATLLLQDLHDLGFISANNYRRVRANGAIENHVYVNSPYLPTLFAEWGLTPGKSNWNYDGLKWLLDLPKYLQAAWLAGLFSAEMGSPLIRWGKLLGGALMKQGGLNPLPLLRVIRELLECLGFRSEIYPSGQPYKGKQTYQLLVSGGQQQTIELWRSIGFPYARYKQRAAAKAMSVVWQRTALVQKRQRAVELCRALRPSGVGVYDLAETVTAKSGMSVSHSCFLLYLSNLSTGRN